ncbi:MAG: hypothetical protein IKV86_06765 [Clostridia bacterium]|nr:hypothetical protein [Clostridia bacterium]
MKKLLVFALVLSVIITSFSAVVSADGIEIVIPENGGKGTVLSGGIDDLVGAVKNCSNTDNSTGTNKNWSVVSIVDIDDTYFDKAVRIESKGTNVAPGTNQVRLQFATDGIEAGEYIYVSFYYRQLSSLGDKTYTEKTPAFSIPEIGKNSGRVTPITQTSQYLSAEQFDTWYKVSFIYPISAAVAAGNTYVQLGFSKPSAGLPEYVMEVADLKIMTFGLATGPSSDYVKTEINNVISTADFSSVTFDGAEVDLSVYPDEYTQSIYWNGTLPVIDGTDVNGNPVDVEYDGDSVPQTVKLTAYCMDYDVTNYSDDRKKEYLVNIDFYRAATSVTVDGTATTDLSSCTGGEKVVMNASIYNPLGETADYTAVMGIYNGKKCLATIPWKISVTGTDVSKTIPVEYTLPAGDYTDCEVRTFVISPLRMFKVN